MKSRICDILGIKYPIFQGGMAWVSTAELAAAVSNAGGFGLIAAAHCEAAWVKEQIIKARTLTDKPFGVNVLLLSQHADEVIDVVCEMKIDAITTGAGNPGKYINKLKEANVKVFPVVSAVSLAVKMERLGVSGIIAEGSESGGHIGELNTMALVPQIVDAVNIPVLAAGGIADSRGVIAALALGAEGVQIGTRFICSTECTVHENYKQIIINSKDRDAVVSGRYTGHPVRAIKNKLTKSFAELEERKAPQEEFDKLGVGSLRAAVLAGDKDKGSFMAGQIAGLVSNIKSCDEIMQELVCGLDDIYKNIGGVING